MPRRIVVIGAGIVGSAVAEQLSARSGCDVAVLERAARGRLPGSTGHAPGFVGLLGPDPVLDELAWASVAVYRELAWRGTPGFHEVGALDLAESGAGAEALSNRLAAAADAGLPVTPIEPRRAAELAPRLVDPQRAIAALRIPGDGVANARAITAALRHRAEVAGAKFFDGAAAVEIERRGERVAMVRTPTARLRADDVVLACGIWGAEAAAVLSGVDLPLFPAGHPYVYNTPHRYPRPPSPLVRWPEYGVYTRDHGDREGLGVSAHELVDGELDSAELPWPGGALGEAVSSALELLPSAHRWAPRKPLLGVLSLTADGLPLLGRVGAVEGLWSAQAIWVAHAAGAARVLVAYMFEGAKEIDRLSPRRFEGEPPEALRRRAFDTIATGPGQRHRR